MTEDEWYKQNACNHSHCINECEHPQPFMLENNLVCGRCWFIYKIKNIMIPCTPENCKE